jgi:hypothetical protein
MNRYIMIRRLRWPAILMLAGVVALLDQLGAIDHFWHWFIPLLLIMVGVLMLAERAALAMEGDYVPYPGQFPAGPYPGAADPYVTAPVPPQPAPPGTSIVPVAPHELDLDRNGDRNGGQS